MGVVEAAEDGGKYAEFICYCINIFARKSFEENGVHLPILFLDKSSAHVFLTFWKGGLCVKIEQFLFELINSGDT